jgi:copper chaperone CopZ
MRFDFDRRREGGSVPMADDVGADQFTIFRVEGMHCHRCNETIQKALKLHPGVHEVEVDFNSGLASVLYDVEQVDVKTLTDAITEAGYHVTGFTHGNGGGGE